MISIVLPVYNEELVLRQNTLKIFEFCKNNLKDEWQIVVSDNASTDKTSLISQELVAQYPQIKYLRTQQQNKEQGKGYAVINAWQKFKADIYVFMDIDLSTKLNSLLNLIYEIKNGQDIVVGSRFIKGAKVNRSILRKTISLILRLILKILFNLKVKDAPCGFKAVNQKVVDQILPKIKNRTWFFDTEMLILAQRQGLKIKEIPVDWQETITQQRKSKVGISKVIKEYIKNIFSLYGRK